MNKLQEIVEEEYPRFKGLEDKLELSEDEFIGFCASILHSGGIAMSIRNHYKLWDINSENHLFFKNEMGIDHADDMSGVILREIRKKHLKENE